MSAVSAGATGKILETSTPALDDGTSYTSAWFDVSQFNSIVFSLKTDQDGVYYIQFSPDKTNIDSTLTYEFDVSQGFEQPKPLAVTRQYARAVFTNNSGSNQTYFRSQFIGSQNIAILSTNLNADIDPDSSALLVRPTSAQDEIRTGRRVGVTGWTKFGYRIGLTAAGGEQTVWATTGNYTVPTSADTYNITYNSGTDGDGTNGAQQVIFYHIDENGLPVTETHTLGSSGSDTTSFSGLGVNRIAIIAGSTTYNANTITITHTTSGDTMAVVPAGQSVTQQAIFHVGSDHRAVAEWLYLNALRIGAGGAGNEPKIVIKGYVFNRNVGTRYEVFRTELDTGVENTVSITDPIKFNLNATDVLYFVADADTDNTDIIIRFSLNEYKNA